MRKLLYITNSQNNIDALSKCIEKDFEIESSDSFKSDIVTDQDVIVIDLNTGSVEEMGILEMLRTATAYKNIPILLSVNDSCSEIVCRGLSGGASDILVQPFIKTNVEETLNNSLKPNKNISLADSEVIRLFISSFELVLQTTAGYEIKHNQEFIRRDYQFCGDLTASIELSGSVIGTVSISMNTKTARHMSASIAWMEPDELDEQMISEGIAEIANQVAGRVRTILSNQNEKIEISLPEVVNSFGQKAVPKLDEPLYTVIFEINGSFLALQLCLSKVAKSPVTV